MCHCPKNEYKCLTKSKRCSMQTAFSLINFSTKMPISLESIDHSFKYRFYCSTISNCLGVSVICQQWTNFIVHFFRRVKKIPPPLLHSRRPNLSGAAGEREREREKNQLGTFSMSHDRGQNFELASAGCICVQLHAPCFHFWHKHCQT